MEVKKFDFRYAKREDTALILQFIKELADYEKMLNEVVADEKTLLALQSNLRSPVKGVWWGLDVPASDLAVILEQEPSKPIMGI